MNFKLHLILKYFFHNNKGEFRKTFLFQIIALYIGSLLIALTYGIMDGMEYETSEKIKSFNYMYSVSGNELTDSLKSDNSGKVNIALIKNNDFSFMVNVYTFSDFRLYYNKIYVTGKIQKNPFRYSKTKDKFSGRWNSFIQSEHMIIIGEDLSQRYNLAVGSIIELSDIINANPITGSYLSEKFMIGGIYSFDFLNYESNNVFIAELGTLFKNNDTFYYFNKEPILDNNFNNSFNDNEEFSSLLSAINLEKYIYAGLGVFILLIASIMIFNNTIIILLEKRKQYLLLISQGLSKKFILTLCLLSSVIVSLLCSTVGYCSSFIFYFLNQKYNILKYLFIYSPFDKIPIIISFDKYILNLILVLVLTIIATIFAISRVNKEKEGL